MSERTTLEPNMDAALSALADGELDAERECALRARVEREPELARRLAELEAVDAQLRALPVPAVPAALAGRLRERIRAEDSELFPPSGPAARASRRVSGAVGLALVAGLALYLVVGAPPESDPLEVEVADDELAIAVELDALRDFELIDQLELLEAMAAAEETSG